MTRIKETNKMVNQFFKNNHYHFELKISENTLNYSIELGLFPLCFQIEFWNEQDELRYLDEYCVLQSWIPLSDWGDEQIKIEIEEINSSESLIDEIESIIPKYKEYLRVINKIEKHISDNKDIMSELELEYNKDIDFNSFLR